MLVDDADDSVGTDISLFWDLNDDILTFGGIKRVVPFLSEWMNEWNFKTIVAVDLLLCVPFM